MECYTTIFDSYEWLPPYGENHVSVDANVVTIHYDNPHDETNKEYPFAKRSYIFDGISSFCESVFPGVACSTFDCNTDEKMSFNVLFEINYSEQAKKWNEYWQKTSFTFMYKNRHLCQFFTTSNTAINVICTGVTLSDEVLLKTAEWR